MARAFIGRQPIYDANLNVAAYELLFRDSEDNRANVEDADQATASVLVNLLLEIGVDAVTGGLPAFVNFPQQLLLDGPPIPCDPSLLTIEILENVQPCEPLFDAVRRLAAEGFTIALDDFVYSEDHAPLVEAADIVKLDVQAQSLEALRSQLAVLRRRPVRLLAEKVETMEEYETYRDLGFELFQGWFLSRPRVLAGATLTGSKLALVQLLAKLHDPESETREIEEMIVRDVALSHKLLRYINSSAFGLRRTVDSVHQAAVLIGLDQLRHLVTLMVLSGIEDKPSSLVDVAVVRGKMCELLGVRLGRHDAKRFFTVGLLSALDLLLDRSMHELLNDIPLAHEVNEALLHREGVAGSALSCVLAYERADWADARLLGLEPEAVRACYLDAVNFAQLANGTSQQSHEPAAV